MVDKPAVFDGKAAEYDEWYRTPAGRRIDALEKAAVWRAARPKPEEAALDVGCGTGNYTLALARKGLAVSGVDVSADMLAAAERKAKTGWSAAFRRADATALPFAAESFELVLSVTAFEFIPEPERAMAECWRVLRSGGRLVVAFLAGASAWARAYKKAANSDEDSVFRQARFWTVDEARGWLPGVTPRIWSALWGPPEAFIDPQVSGQAPDKRRGRGGTPGFLVLRWDKAD